MRDTYKEVKIMEFPGMTARIHIPDLSPAERVKRMKVILKHAAELLKKI